MALSPNDIALLAEEVGRATLGGRVQRVRDGREGEVVLQLRRPGETVSVLLASGTPAARLLLSSVEPPRRPEPTPFVQLLRKAVGGGRLVAVSAHEGDRLVELFFAVRRPDEPEQTARILAELSGRHGNLFLVDGAGLIRGSLRPNVSKARPLVPGRPWTPPRPPPAHWANTPTTLMAGTASLELERRVEAELAAAAAEATFGALERELQRLRKRAERRLSRIVADAARATQADEYQRLGELLQTAWGVVKPGASEVTVPDFYDAVQAPVTIELDPRRSLADNVQRYFKEAKRRRASREHIAPRRAETEAELASLDEALARLRPDLAPDAVVALRAELEDERVLPRRQARPPGGHPAPERALPYWTFESRAGLPILVGKSAADNDELTLKVARGRDLWLHVDGTAGSHVVVRLERGAEVDSESLVDAALLAAHYSKRREDSAVDVRYTLKKHVSKPKGMPPGRVTLAGSKTVRVRRDPERIKRLFETRG